jgi:hypothetical protein
VFSGQIQLSRVPQEVGEVVMQFGVVRKCLQARSAKKKKVNAISSLRSLLARVGKKNQPSVPFTITLDNEGEA